MLHGSILRCLVLFFLISGLTSHAFSQSETMSTATGRIHFTSDAPMEVIEATSSATRGVLHVARRTFAFTLPVNSFNGFNNALQKDLFNENYLESEKYPEATYSGRIIEQVDLTIPGTYDIRAKGNLVIHGIPRERIIRCKLIVKPDEIKVVSTFTVRLGDHHIQVPRIVHQKIAEEIHVDLQFTLKPL